VVVYQDNGQFTPDPSAVTYIWHITRTEGNRAPINSTDETIVVSPGELSSGTYTIRYVATYTRNALACGSSFIVTINPTPTISLSVLPATGNALSTVFTARASASGGSGAFRYSFTASSVDTGTRISISGFRANETATFVLGEGNWRVSLSVIDGDGSRASAQDDTVLTVIAESPANSLCQNLTSAVRSLEAIVERLGGVVLNSTVLIDEMRNALAAASNDVVLSDRIGRLTPVALDTVGRIPSNDSMVQECPNYNQALFGAIPGTSTFQGFRDGMTDVLLTAVLQDSLMRSTRPDDSLSVAQVVVGSLAGPSVSVNSSVASQFISVLSSALNSTSAEDLTSTSFANDTLNALELLTTQINVASESEGQSSSACNVLDQNFGLVNQVLQRVGSSRSASDTYSRDSLIFSSSTSSFFTDQTVSFTLSGVQVTLQAATLSGSISERGVGVFGAFALNMNFPTCRSSSLSGFTINDSISISLFDGLNVTNVTMEFNNVRNVEGMNTSCRFWDTETKSWSQENIISVGPSTCRSNHLTEFGLFVGGPLPAPFSDSDDDGFNGELGFLILAGLFGALACFSVYPLIKICRELRNDHWVGPPKYYLKKWILIFFQLLGRVAFCVILYDRDDRFGTSNVVTWVLLAIPFSLVWSSYTLTVYTWSSSVHNDFASRVVSPEGKFCFFYVGNTVLCVIIWACLALLVFWEGQTAAIGPIVLLVINFAMILFVGVHTNFIKKMAGDSGAHSSNKQSASEDLQGTSTHNIIFSILLAVQCVILIGLALSDSVAIWALFLLIDLCTAVLQIDYIQGKRAQRLLCNGCVDEQQNQGTVVAGSDNTGAARGTPFTPQPVEEGNDRKTGLKLMLKPSPGHFTKEELEMAPVSQPPSGVASRHTTHSVTDPRLIRSHKERKVVSQIGGISLMTESQGYSDGQGYSDDLNKSDAMRKTSVIEIKNTKNEDNGLAKFGTALKSSFAPGEEYEDDDDDKPDIAALGDDDEQCEDNEDEATRLFKKLDIDNSGNINLQEFKQGIQEIIKATTPRGAQSSAQTVKSDGTETKEREEAEQEWLNSPEHTDADTVEAARNKESLQKKNDDQDDNGSARLFVDTNVNSRNVPERAETPNTERQVEV